MELFLMIILLIYLKNNINRINISMDYMQQAIDRVRELAKKV